MAGYSRKEDDSNGCQRHDNPADAPARNTHPCCSLQMNIDRDPETKGQDGCPCSPSGESVAMGAADSRRQYILTPELRLVLLELQSGSLDFQRSVPGVGSQGSELSECEDGSMGGIRKGAGAWVARRLQPVIGPQEAPESAWPFRWVWVCGSGTVCAVAGAGSSSRGGEGSCLIRPSLWGSAGSRPRAWRCCIRYFAGWTWMLSRRSWAAGRRDAGESGRLLLR